MTCIPQYQKVTEIDLKILALVCSQYLGFYLNYVDTNQTLCAVVHIGYCLKIASRSDIHSIPYQRIWVKTLGGIMLEKVCVKQLGTAETEIDFVFIDRRRKKLLPRLKLGKQFLLRSGDFLLYNIPKTHYVFWCRTSIFWIWRVAWLMCGLTRL